MNPIYLSVLCLVLMYLYVTIINVEYPGYTQKNVVKYNFAIILISMILNEMHCRRLLRQCIVYSISRLKKKTSIIATMKSLAMKYKALRVVNVLGELSGWTHGKK